MNCLGGCTQSNYRQLTHAFGTLLRDAGVKAKGSGFLADMQQFFSAFSGYEGAIELQGPCKANGSPGGAAWLIKYAHSTFSDLRRNL